MKPSQVALDLGPPFDDDPRSSDDFEEIPHPASQNAYWSQPSTTRARDEELPLHYMSEEKARRRVTRGPGGNGGGGFAGQVSEKSLDYDAYDDEGKDVYSKMKASNLGPISSGRPRRPPPPPPTTIVRPSVRPYMRVTDFVYVRPAARVLRTEPGACPADHLHAALVLDPVPQDR